MKNVKLIITDLDFTLLHTDKNISKYSQNIFRKCSDQKSALNIANKFSDCKLICYRGENLYGFVNKNAGKVQAIKSLAKCLNIELSNIIAFGDDLNDIEMLEQCGYGIAVSNAIEEVLNIADYITDSNDEDGVAKFIEKNIFL